MARDAVAAGEGALRTCSTRPVVGEDEVVDQAAVAREGLSADAEVAGFDVLDLSSGT